MKVSRKYDPRWAKGHIKDELLELIRIYHKYCVENNMIPKADLYMNEITYGELCKELGCTMLNQSSNTYGRIYGYNIRLDNCIAPHVFELREEDNMSIKYCKNDVDTIDDYIYAFESRRGAGKSNKVRTCLPTKYVISDKAIILFWDDGDKTVVKKAKDDNNDPVKGFLWAYFIKHSKLSKTKANKYLKDLVMED